MSLRPGIAAAAPLLFLMSDGAAAAQTNAPEAPKTAIKLTTVAKGLENPWALEFLPDGRMLVTERPAISGWSRRTVKSGMRSKACPR